MMALNFDDATLVIITGASRGIGKSIALNFAKKFQNNSQVTLILLARNQTQLNIVKSQIEEQSSHIVVIAKSIDLVKPSKAELQAILDVDPGQFKNNVLIHNAGSTGDVTKRACELDSFDNWQNYLAFNFTTVVVFTSLFIKKFRGTKMFIVNITSLVGREPFPSFAQYGCGKAVRDMYFKVLAKEEVDSDIFVLNYSPGPCDTDMVRELPEKMVLNGQMFRDLIDRKKLLDPNESVDRLLAILEKGLFYSGQLIDYFDQIENNKRI